MIRKILPFFALFLASSALAAPVVLDRVEASVNAAIILKSDVEHFRKTEKLRAQLDPLYAGTSVAAKGASATEAEIVDFLINERLILQLFPVGDPEVEQEIGSIQSNNRISREELKTALTQQGFSFEDYFELIRSSAAKRNLIDREIRTKIAVTDNDVKNYFYNRLSKDSTAARSYRIRLIFVSPRSYKTPGAAKEVAQRALKSIRDGESFEEVAKRSSDDASAPSGGDLGTVTEDQISPVIREQLKKLQIGQVSDVFGSATSGFYILKLEDVKSEESQRLEKMKEEIRNQLITSEYQHQISLWLERQRQNAFIHRAGTPAVAGLPLQSP